MTYGRHAAYWGGSLTPPDARMCGLHDVVRDCWPDDVLADWVALNRSRQTPLVKRWNGA